MDKLPSGTVSFCFTDIEGSTKLFARLGAQYERLLDEHRRLIRDAITPFGGVEIKTEGDGCFLAFQDALDAVKAAGAMQHAIDQHGWPEDARIRIRVGVHTGEAQPSGRDYVALSVHQAARVADTGHGGQVIVSAATAAHLDRDALSPLHLADLGEYRLRSFDEACHLYQLAGPGLATTFPPLRTRSAVSKRIRIFLSSPGDVKAAREIAALTIERLAQEYVRFFAVDPYFWDYEAMIAAGQFQDPADPPSAFDIVVLIVWSRLGTQLPERTAVRTYRGIDERAPLTGTEWEFEEALQAATARGVPDLLIYRCQERASIECWDAESRRRDFEQLDALDRFWSRLFANQGAFIGGYTEFARDADFAELLEQNLRQLIEKRIAALEPDHGPQTAKVWMRAPFRGLEAYEFEHAPIFFGQDGALTKAMVQLAANAEAGSPFLLVLGASGSGKSSLAKAGIVPKLFVPRRIPGAAFLRRVVFRPSDAREGEDLFDALACKLTTQAGTAEALCELIGPGQSVSSLAAHLRNSTTEPAYPIGTVLGQLAVAARREGRMLEYETPKLVLVVDQLEELFTNELLGHQERQRFVALLAGLVHSGLVWVIATMRKDFWHRADDLPELVQLAEGNGRLELLPPTQLQLSQMIRRPAAAAGVVFEHHNTTDVPLNEVIAEEVANEPGALPLLSYLMDQLYRTDVLGGHDNTLTFATYEKLGRLEGAIATKAEAVLEACAPADRQTLGSVLFSLVQMSATEGDIERAVSRRVPLSNFPSETPQRRLVEALLHPDARLLVSDAEQGGEPTVRVAHEALITRWSRARDFVQGNAQALKIRRRIEERFALWRGLKSTDGVASKDDDGNVMPLRARFAAWNARFGHEAGLLTEIDLIDGQRLLRDHRADTESHIADYIERSTANDKRMRTRSLRVLSVVASVVTVLAIVSSAAGLIAFQQRQEARHQRDEVVQGQMRLLTGAAAGRLTSGDIPGAQSRILEVFSNRNVTREDGAAAATVFQDIRAADFRLSVLSGHRASVSSARYSPDGARIVTASVDGTARIWDASTGAQLLVLVGHGNFVLSAGYSPDGKRIVTASLDKTARVWDAASGVQLFVLRGHGDIVQSAEFSPDGRYIATASTDKTVRIWDADTGAQLKTFSGHSASIYFAGWSPDGKRIVTASADKTARVWDATSGAQLAVLSGHGGAVNNTAFSPDGTRIVTVSDDKTARIWDARTGAQRAVFRGHNDLVESAAWSPDGKRVVTASNDKTARIWDAGTGTQLAVLSGHSSFVSSAFWSPDGRRIVTASADKTASIWDASQKPQLAVLTGHGDLVFSAAWSPDGKRLVTASADKTARIWDVGKASETHVLKGHSGWLSFAAWSPDGKRIVTSSEDRTVRIWNAGSGTQLAVIHAHSAHVSKASYSPDGGRIVTSSEDKTARIWDAITGARLAVLSGHSDSVGSSSWSPDGTRIVTASGDRTARIWDAASGAQLAVLSGHSDGVSSAAWSADGKFIVTASGDKTARIWDAGSGALIRVLSGNTSAINSAAWSPDGKRIVTSSVDRFARIWDAATGDQLGAIAGHSDVVFSAAYSPDGLHVATASADKTARIWDATVPARLGTQIVWYKAAEFDPLTDIERVQLGLSQDARVRSWPDDASKCDSQAAAMYDPDRLAPGVIQEEIAADVVSLACTREIAKSGSSPRLVYEMGRALNAKRDVKIARDSFATAVSGGYRAAQIDLAKLLADPSAGMPDPGRAVTLYEKAWQDGVPIAAFELGELYERGVRGTGATARVVLQPDPAKARSWYRKGADAGEPNALARFGERYDASAVAEKSPPKKDELLLKAFAAYAAAAERAEDEDWPDDAWKAWRYRRATLARLLAHEGMMQQVADVYDTVRRKYAPQPPTMFDRIRAWMRSP